MPHEGLVFGKFYPYHLGHRALIDFARRPCRRLNVVVCVADSEDIPGEERKRWIEVDFMHCPDVEVRLLHYNEDELPNTSVSSHEVSRLWAAKFKSMMPALTAVFTSEPYGDYLAGYMDIVHIPFDKGRDLVPVSGTAIRERPLTHWEYIPEQVRGHFAKRIVLVGTESTGKTTLAAELAGHFGTRWVPEAARYLISDSRIVRWEDLCEVLDAQAEAFRQAYSEKHKVVFIDTGLPTTLSYARYLFGREPKLSEKMKADYRADLYLLLEADVPYVQDGTRLEEEDRRGLQTALEQELEGLPVVRIRGDWEERRLKAIAVVEEFLARF